MKITILSILYILSGLMTFFFGYKLSLDNNSFNLSFQTFQNNLNKEIKCKEEDNEKKEEIIDNIKNEIIEKNEKNEKKIRINNLNYYKFHKNNDKSVVELVFGEYYHPSSMSKAEFILTSLNSWISHNNNNKINNHNSSSSNNNKIYCTEMYHTRTGSRTNQPAKCVAVVTVEDGQHSPWLTSNRYGFTAGKTNQYMNDYTVYYNRKMNEQQLYPFLYERQYCLNEFLKRVGSPIVDKETAQLNQYKYQFINSTHVRRSIVIMVANEGVMNLLLNFVCSCVASGIKPSTIVVFIGDKDHIPLIESIGAIPIYLPAAGAMPRTVASNYGDDIFGKMMWLKITSVYLALSSGFNVLFQDADLVWFQDPFPHLHKQTKDISFMDDGARSGRFNPYFANSGFYFMKYNKWTIYLIERMLHAVSEVHVTKSHQSVMTRYMTEAISLTGLEIAILDVFKYPSGKIFHHNKTYMKQLIGNKIFPVVFHMCWTANSQQKIDNFKSIDKWYLRDTNQCSNPSGIAAYGMKLKRNSHDDNKMLETCCVNPHMYHDTVKIKEEKELSEREEIESEATEEQ